MTHPWALALVSLAAVGPWLLRWVFFGLPPWEADPPPRER